MAENTTQSPSPSTPPNVKVYDRPERKGPSPIVLALCLLALLAIGFLTFRALRPAANTAPAAPSAPQGGTNADHLAWFRRAAAS